MLQKDKEAFGDKQDDPVEQENVQAFDISEEPPLPRKKIRFDQRTTRGEDTQHGLYSFSPFSLSQDQKTKNSDVIETGFESFKNSDNKGGKEKISKNKKTQGKTNDQNKSIKPRFEKP